jgi:gliding motility-associated-like protein
LNRKLLAFVVGLLVAFAGHAQVASFTVNPASGCAPLPVSFNNTSTGATSYSWSFGDTSAIVTGANPGVHIYTYPGKYVVTLTINGSISTSDTVNVYSSPTVSFGVNKTTGCFPLTVTFTSSSTAGSGTISGYSWGFGDGTSSNEPNPVHTYVIKSLAVGFPVTLLITNSFGCTNAVTDSNVVNIPSGVTPSFQTIASQGCKVPITVQFNNTSTGPGNLTYLWSFGDGSDDTTTTSPGHTYNASGTYNVKLIATSSAGCQDSVMDSLPILAGNVMSSFTAPDSVCVGTLISFVNNSAPIPTVYTWSFGDGASSSMYSPTHIYTTAGIYSVKLTNTFGSCIDSISKQITVLTPAVANFTSSATVSCDSLFSVQFTDQSTGANAWSWSFGDGGTSQVQNPIHQYKGYGVYTVSLIASNSAGCSGPLTKNQYIENRKPFIQISDVGSKGCAPFIFTPTLIDTVVDGIASYAWNFGDSTTSNSPNPPPHPYPNPGTYYVTLTIKTNGGCTASTVDTVMVGTIKPVVSFTESATTVCASTPVSFTDESTPASNNGWLWNFGNGNFSTIENPVYQFPSPGVYIVTLTAYNNGCNDSAKATITVNPPLAKFTYTYSCNGNNSVFLFHDSSIKANTWSWNFGDDSTSNLENPSHTYAVVDSTYTVSLTVTNTASGCSNTTTQQVLIVHQKPTISATHTIICVNTPIVISVGGVSFSYFSSFTYNFGDGTVINAGFNANLGHTYTKAGLYTVTVISTEVTGCNDTVTKANFIQVNGPTAQFSPSAVVGCTGLNTTFTDLSTTDGTHPIKEWIWDYGDGTIDTSNGPPPFIHDYTKQGIYTVSLTVIDASGCSSAVVKTNLITVAYPTASFTTLDSMSCPASPIQFVNNSKGYGLTYKWFFGDGVGDTSTLTDPLHTYPIGDFKASLYVLDQFGCKDSAINYNIIVDTPSASFTLTGTFASCPPLIDTFTFTGSYYKTLNWYFGGGGVSSLDSPVNYYNIPGTYYPYVVATSHGGCTSTSPTQMVTILGPYGTFSYSPLEGCHTLTVNFNVVTGNIVKFLWLYSNYASDSSFAPSSSYTYDSAGFYIPKVVLEDTTLHCDVVLTGDSIIYVYGTTPKFVYNTNTLCANGTVQFTDSTKVFQGESVGTYFWDFGDGNTSSLQNPSHYYASTGIYTVKEVVTTTTGCQDSVIENNLIRVVANPVVDIGGANSQCVPSTLNFQGIEVLMDTSVLNWSWNFYNASANSNQQNPPAQIYSIPGSDSVELVATNSSGCKDTVTKYFSVYPLPPTNAGADTTICQGQNASLQASGASTYNWLPPNGTLSCTNCANPLATPNTTTTYIVNGTSSFGCMQTDTVVVNVITPLSLSVSPSADSLCIGQSVILTASGETIYSWSPVAGLNNPNIPNPVATPDTTTLYQVTGTDIKSCFTDTETVLISVFNYPKVDLGSNVSILVGSSYQISANGSTDIDSINWIPATGLSCSNCLNPVATPVNTTTYIINVENSGGCAASDSITIMVTCNNSNLFVPNTFSPNNDGVNDVFYVRGKGLSNIQSMRIFNRWGQMVFEKLNFAPNDPSAGWNGTFNGKNAPIDVYVYTIEVVCENSQVIPYHGNVALIR